MSPVMKSRKIYKGNGSDSDDSEVKERNKWQEKYRNRGSHLNEKEKKVVNYIINKKSPVYGFISFLGKKNAQKAEKEPAEKASPTIPTNSQKVLDVNEMKMYMTSGEVQSMIRASNHRRQKQQVAKILRARVTYIALKFFRTYFAQKVVNHIRKLFLDSGLKAYKKLKLAKKREELKSEIKGRQGVAKFMKQLMKVRVDTEHDQKASPRKMRGFIGVINRKPPTIKTKIMPKRKVRQENASALPVLAKSVTVINNHLRI